MCVRLSRLISRRVCPSWSPVSGKNDEQPTQRGHTRTNFFVWPPPASELESSINVCASVFVCVCVCVYAHTRDWFLFVRTSDREIRWPLNRTVFVGVVVVAVDLTLRTCVERVRE